MPNTRIRDLVALFRSRTISESAGLWLIPLTMIGSEADEAASVGIDAIDARQPILDTLSPTSRYIGLDVDYLSRVIDSIVKANSGTDVVLVYNLDILLARVTPDGRARFWQHIHSGFKHRTRCIIFTMPDVATELLPAYALLESWRKTSRLIDSDI